MNLVGQQLAEFTPNDNPLLGIRQVVWHPSGAYLVIGGWESKVSLRVLISSCLHPAPVVHHKPVRMETGRDDSTQS
jgi:hypothetical protein